MVRTAMKLRSTGVRKIRIIEVLLAPEVEPLTSLRATTLCLFERLQLMESQPVPTKKTKALIHTIPVVLSHQNCDPPLDTAIRVRAPSTLLARDTSCPLSGDHSAAVVPWVHIYSVPLHKQQCQTSQSSRPHHRVFRLAL